MQQCSSALGIFLAGLILTWSDFPEKAKAEDVTDAMMDSLLIHYIPTVIVLWGLGAMFLLFYPIDEARHEANVERIKALEAEALTKEFEAASLGAPAR